MSYPFLAGGGSAADIIVNFDWCATPLGVDRQLAGQPQNSIALILRSPVPIVTLWGEDGIMIYNDAYSVFAGGRHPKLFGSKVREGWPEVADFNDNIMKVGLAGKTLAYRDFALTLYRNDGKPEQVWLNLDYSPILGEDGKPAAVMAIVVEITDKIRIERELNAEREGLKRMFEQAPGFIAMVNGPDHQFAVVNEAYRTLVGHRDVIGKPVAVALPEVVEQGFVSLLDKVYSTGQPYVGRNANVRFKQGDGSSVDDRYLDFIYRHRQGVGNFRVYEITVSRWAARLLWGNSPIETNEPTRFRHRLRNIFTSGAGSIWSHTLREPELSYLGAYLKHFLVLFAWRAHYLTTSEPTVRESRHEKTIHCRRACVGHHVLSGACWSNNVDTIFPARHDRPRQRCGQHRSWRQQRFEPLG